MDGHTRLTLLLARVLISDPDCWTAGVLARDQTGCPVSPLDESATAWCARGTVYRVVGGDVEAFERAVQALDEASHALYGVPICTVNDGPPVFAHEAVLGAFDHAVDALGLARQAQILATSPTSEGVDVLQVLGPSSRSDRQTTLVEFSDGGLADGEARTPVEKDHVATVPAYT
jgi:hypothetical protein